MTESALEKARREVDDAISALDCSEGLHFKRSGRGCEHDQADAAIARLEAAARKAGRDEAQKIGDRCPGCGSQSLFLGSHGAITCSVLGCRSVTLRMWLDAARLAGRREQAEKSVSIAGLAKYGVSVKAETIPPLREMGLADRWGSAIADETVRKLEEERDRLRLEGGE